MLKVNKKNTPCASISKINSEQVNSGWEVNFQVEIFKWLMQ